MAMEFVEGSHCAPNSEAPGFPRSQICCYKEVLFFHRQCPICHRSLRWPSLTDRQVDSILSEAEGRARQWMDPVDWDGEAGDRSGDAVAALIVATNLAPRMAQEIQRLRRRLGISVEAEKVLTVPLEPIDAV